MDIGNIVEAMAAKDLKVRLGIVINKLQPVELGLEVFEVMTCDGKINTYTSAALRIAK